MNFKNKTKQRFTATLLIISILIPVFMFSMAKRVAAQDKSASACTAVIVAAKLEAKITKTKADAVDTVSVPVKTGATIVLEKIAGDSTGTTKFKYKECIKEVITEILKNLAKRALLKMTEATVNWINSGFHGSPLFVENPDSFFKDIAKYEIKRLVNMIGYDTGGQPFGKGFAIGIINSFKNTFENNARYSLSKVTNDPTLLEGFRTNFSVGGWNGFYLATQFPQNNFVGANINYANQLASQLEGINEVSGNATKKIKTALEQGQGFLSPQVCKGTNAEAYNAVNKNPWKRPVTFKSNIRPRINDCSAKFQQCYINNPDYVQCLDEQSACEVSFKTYTDSLAKERSDWKNQNECEGGLVTTTPGSVVADQIMTATSSVFRQTELGIAMGNSLSAIFDSLLNQLFKKGLSALSSKKNTPPDDADDFNYYGNTLGPNTTTTGAPDTFDWNQKDKPDPDIEKIKSDGKKFIAPSCPDGQIGTPPDCVEDGTYLGPPISTCPTGQTGTPPNCVVDLGPPPPSTN